jgi:glutamine cyclotransferase
MSDGSPYLYFVEPESFEVQDKVLVTGVNGPVSQLNELEYIDGEVYANVWQTNWIVRIDPESGNVVGYIDLTGLHQPENQTGGEDVLNGIAYDEENDRLFVTGKLWPTLYEIELVE